MLGCGDIEKECCAYSCKSYVSRILKNGHNTKWLRMVEEIAVCGMAEMEKWAGQMAMQTELN